MFNLLYYQKYQMLIIFNYDSTSLLFSLSSFTLAAGPKTTSRTHKPNKHAREPSM